jgi:molecular chaperone GrpE
MTMSDKNANDNTAPDAAAKGDGKKAAPESEAPEAEAPKTEAPETAAASDAGKADAEAEKTAWEKGPEAEIEALATEAADLKDRLLRTMAEMENMRRRAERERDDAKKYAVTAFARDMLAVGDNMHRAIQSLGEEARADADATVKTLIEGVEMTEREMNNVFERHGIKRVEPKGERFDPNFHQAMFEVENAEVAAGTVIEVVAAGYIIGERVLRPAMVGVSKGGPKETPKPAEDKAEEKADADQPKQQDSAAEAQAAAKSHKEAADNKTSSDAGKNVDKSA